MEQISEKILPQSAPRRYFLDVVVAGVKVRALVDTGSTRTYVGGIFENHLRDLLEPIDAEVTVADGSKEKINGIALIPISVNAVERKFPVRLVCSFDFDCVLGIDFLITYGFQIDFGSDRWRCAGIFEFDLFVLEENVHSLQTCVGLAGISDEQRKRVMELVDKLVEPPGATLKTTNLLRHEIDVQGHRPLNQKMRPMSPPILKAAQESVDKLLQDGVIEPCRSPWCSPPVLHKKKDGSYRFCVDYRKVNAVTKKHAHPIPGVDSILDNLRKARHMSKIDMKSAFHQIEIEENSRDITAFSVRGRGQFRYKRLPFGVTNGPASYQEAMDKFLHECLPPGADEFVFAYMDDLCVATETFEDHLKWLEIVLRAIRKANLQINLEKSEFCCSSVKYLGFVVDEHGLHTDPEKVQAIIDYPPPRPN